MSNHNEQVFRSSDSFIERQLDMVKENERPLRRFELDVADLMTGPTSAGNAQYLAENMCKRGKELAERMKEVAERYLAAIEEQNT